MKLSSKSYTSLERCLSEQFINESEETLLNRNSLDQKIIQTNNKTKLKNFWNWFGDSKVVDDKGRPLVVYHGSRFKDIIKSFDPKHGFNINAVYFSSSPHVAAHWSGTSTNSFLAEEKLKDKINNATTEKQLLTILNKELADGKIKLEKIKDNEFDQYGYQYRISDGISSAPLGYKNPDVENDYFYPADRRYGMDEVHRNSVEELRKEALYAIERMEKKLYSTGRTYHCYLKIENPLIINADGNSYHSIPFNGKRTNTETIASYAFENNYDGVIIYNVYETDLENQKCDDYIVFDGKQIKNIKNSGKFSLTSDNMFESKNIL